MNLMGKIFTLLIFFMSICFLVIAVMVGASQSDWKQVATEMKQRANTAAESLKRAKSSTTEQEKLLAAERFSRAAQLSELASQKRRLEEALEEKEKQLRAATEDSQRIATELKNTNERLSAKDKEVRDLKENNMKLVDDIESQLTTVRSLIIQSKELENQVALLTEKEANMVETLTKQERVLGDNGLSIDSPTQHITPKLEGKVVKVGKEAGADSVFAISVGQDDGLRVGHVLDIRRGSRYIGRGTIVEVKHDIAAVRPIKDFMTDRVREGDDVTSKL